MFVVEDGVEDVNDADADAIVGGAFAVDDFVGLVANVGLDFRAVGFGNHGDDGLTASIGRRPDGKFGIAVLTDLVGVDGFRMKVEKRGDFGAEASGVENGTGADNAILGEAGVFPDEIGEDVHRVGNDEKNAVKTRLHDFFDHGFDDF